MEEQKISETIKRIKKMRKERNTVLCSLPKGARKRSDYNNDVLAFTTAIEALERQLPKKPKEEKNAYTSKLGEFRVGKCPNCEMEVSDRFGACLDCGQKLDWTVEE